MKFLIKKSIKIKLLWVEEADPTKYREEYGESLLSHDQLPEIANEVQNKHGKYKK